MESPGVMHRAVAGTQTRLSEGHHIDLECCIAWGCHLLV
jgi:hypothetical protein